MSRTIETILKLSGEGAYRDALRQCNAEMKVQKSELARITSEYRTNANSMDALTAKGKALERMYSTQAAKVDVLRSAVKQSVAARAQEEQTLDELRGQYDEAKAAMEKYGQELGENSQEYQEAKAKVEALRDAIIDHKAKLDSAAKATTDYTVKLNRAEVELNDLADRQQVNNQLLAEAKASADGCATSIDRYGDSIKVAADGTEKSASAVEALASAFVASGVKQEIEDVAAALMECSEASTEYEATVKKVSTIADENVMSQRQMKDGILEASTDLSQHADDVAEAAYEALSAGIQTKDALGFVREASMLAVAGFTENATAVDVMTTVLNAYDMSAIQTEAVASKLVKTQDLGKLTVDEMGKSFGRVIPSAAAYNVSLDNVCTSYALMTSRGINVENTTTYLTTMLDELADSGSKVSTVLQTQTGSSFAELMSEGMSLGDVLDIIGQSVNNDATQFGNLWSSATAGRAALALFGSGAAQFNQAMDQMANSSGTVAKNYEKMASTSQFAQQRMEVSARNLKIAVGDQLNPALNELRANTADVYNAAADLVAENPALVAGIVGVTAAVGALAGALSIVTAIKAVQAAMAALNITMMANPAVLVATALVGVGTALVTYAAATESAQEKVDALTESSRALSDTIDANQRSYDDNVASTMAAADTAMDYISRLEELEAQGLDTAAAQLEYKMTLDQINNLMPGVNATINEQTHAVDGGTNALREQAAAWKENAIQQAAYARYQDDLSAYSDALYECNKNRALLSMEEKNAVSISKEIADNASKISQLERNRADIMSSTTMSTRDQAAAVLALDQEIQNLIDSNLNLNTELTASKDNQEILTQAVEDGENAISEMQPAIDAATEAYQEMSGAAEETGAKSTEMADAVEESSEQASAAYIKMRDAALESFESTFGLFEKAKIKSQYTAEQMAQNLQTQADAFNSYADNLKAAFEKGVDLELLQSLSDGSKESMGAVAALATASEENVARINAAWSGTGEAKSGAAEIVAAINSAVEGADVDLSSAGVSKGQQYGSGIAEGVKSSVGGAGEAVSSELAEAGTQGGAGLAEPIAAASEEAASSMSVIPAAASEAAAGVESAFARCNAGGAMAGAMNNVVGAITGAKGRMYSEAKAAAAQVIAGLVDGVNQNLNSYSLAMAHAGTVGVNAYKIASGASSKTASYSAPMAPAPQSAGMPLASTVDQFSLTANTPEIKSLRSSIMVRQAAVPDYTSITNISGGPQAEPVLPMLGKILTALENGAVLRLDDGSVVGRIDSAMGQRSALAERGAV